MSWTTFWRGTVAPEQCDHLGHMNVARYFDCCSDGVFALQERIGLGRDAVLDRRRVSFAVVNARADFHAEVHAGEALRLDIAIAEIGTRSMRNRHRLYAGDPERLAFEAEFKAVLLDLDTRRATALPGDIAEALARYLLSEEDRA